MTYFADLEKSLADLGTTNVNIGGKLTGFCSYRGYYVELAMIVEPWDYQCIPADELLSAIQKARSRSFTGWKGGEYHMINADTLYVVEGESRLGEEVVGLDARNVFGETTTVYLATVDSEGY